MLRTNMIGVETCARRNRPLLRESELDPFRCDQAGDTGHLVTDRRLSRLLCVAAETAARFEREDNAEQPLRFLHAPLPLFDGRSAVRACEDRDAFISLVMLHQLRLPLTARRSDIDIALKQSDSARGAKTTSWIGGTGRAARKRRGRRLFTCSVSAFVAGRWLNGFGAMTASNEELFVSEIADRWGASAAAEAMITEGFDWSEPVANALVSEAVADMLRLVAAEPKSALASGLCLFVEQRFDH